MAQRHGNWRFSDLKWNGLRKASPPQGVARSHFLNDRWGVYFVRCAKISPDKAKDEVTR